MKITEETKLKDLIPEGYEIDEKKYSNSPFITDKEEFIHVKIRKKEVKDFKWYAKSYFKKLFYSDTISGHSTFTTALFQNDYDSIPFEFKIGLLKFICKDIGIDWVQLMQRNEITSTQKFINIASKEFLESIFK